MNAGAFPHDSADPPMTGSGRMCNSASTGPRSAHPAPAALAPAPPGCSTPIPQAPRVPRASVELGSSSRGTRPGRATPARTHRPARSPPPRNPSGAGHGVLGGSFRPAPHRTAARTAELRGNCRAHPGCRPEQSSQNAKTGSSCCARSGGPRRSRRSGDGVDADVRVGLEQRGQAGDDLGGEEFAAQVRAGLLGGLEAVEDLDVLVADEQLLGLRTGNRVEELLQLVGVDLGAGGAVGRVDGHGDLKVCGHDGSLAVGWRPATVRHWPHRRVDGADSAEDSP